MEYKTDAKKIERIKELSEDIKKETQKIEYTISKKWNTGKIMDTEDIGADLGCDTVGVGQYLRSIIKELEKYKDNFLIIENSNGFKKGFEDFQNNYINLYEHKKLFQKALTEVKEKVIDKGIKFTKKDLENINSVSFYIKHGEINSEIDFGREDFTEEQADFLEDFEFDLKNYFTSERILVARNYSQENLMEATFYILDDFENEKDKKEFYEILDRSEEIYSWLFTAYSFYIKITKWEERLYKNGENEEVLVDEFTKGYFKGNGFVKQQDLENIKKEYDLTELIN